MAIHRLEITLDEETWKRLEAACERPDSPRLPKAGFVKWALEKALDGRSSPGKGEGITGVPQPSPPPAPPRAPNLLQGSAVKTRDQLAMERQAKLNKAKP